MIFDEFGRIAQEITVRLAQPISDFGMGFASRWLFYYLLSAILFAGLILGWRLYAKERQRRGVAISLRSVVTRLPALIFDRRVFLHKSALLDYRYAVINHAITASILAYLIIAVNMLSGVFRDIFSAVPFLQNLSLEAGWMGAVAIVFLYAFTFDTHNFFQHYLQHKVPILWEFHKVHHSAEVLTPVTAVRTHPVAQLFSATVAAIVYGTMNGLGFTVLYGETAEYSLFAANVFSLIFYTVGLYHLKHSHVWFTYPPIIREVFASPSLHLIHHSNHPRHYDKNLAFVFTFWDRVFGTYYAPREDEQYELTLGISEAEGKDEYCTVAQLYMTPFKRAWKLHLSPIFTRKKEEHRLE